MLSNFGWAQAACHYLLKISSIELSSLRCSICPFFNVFLATLTQILLISYRTLFRQKNQVRWVTSDHLYCNNFLQHIILAGVWLVFKSFQKTLHWGDWEEATMWYIYIFFCLRIYKDAIFINHVIDMDGWTEVRLTGVPQATMHAKSLGLIADLKEFFFWICILPKTELISMIMSRKFNLSYEWTNDLRHDLWFKKWNHNQILAYTLHQLL